MCKLDFYSAFHLVPWDVLIAFLCRIDKFSLLLLLRIFEGYSWNSCLVSPGHVERKLFFIADISVDVHGLYSARFRKVHNYAFDLDLYRLPAK